MPRRKATAKPLKLRSVRQSVTVLGPLATEVRRVARERNLTMGRAIVATAERGLRAEAEAKANLKSRYRRFMEDSETGQKDEAVKDLIRAIFGKNAIAEDTVH